MVRRMKNFLFELENHFQIKYNLNQVEGESTTPDSTSSTPLHTFGKC